MENQQNSKPKKTSKAMIALVGVLGCAVVAMGGVLVAQNLSDRGNETQQLGAGNEGNASSVLERGFITEDNVEQIASDMQEKVGVGMFECKMSTYWTFDDAKSASPNSYVANSERNSNTLYFDLVDPNTNEVYYSSQLMPVGTEVKNIVLDKSLPAGVHEMVVDYTLVDENYEEVSTVGFTVTVEVKK